MSRGGGGRGGGCRMRRDGVRGGGRRLVVLVSGARPLAGVGSAARGGGRAHGRWPWRDTEMPGAKDRRGAPQGITRALKSDGETNGPGLGETLARRQELERKPNVEET
jgi:hypothetical protein